MKTTYMVEEIDKSNRNQVEVIGYFHDLSSAKQMAKNRDTAFITKLIGQNFGEGFHKYKLVWCNKKFQYQFRR